MNTEKTVSHTPAPWSYSQGVEEMIMQAHFNVSIPMRPHTVPIAKCFSLTMNLQEAEANARLIAAAPDLLKMLEQAVARMKHSGLPFLEKFETVINKAKGI